MAPRTSWKTLYLDLPENVAARLREKRVKPDQLTAKTDGEILALGLSDVDLETIRIEIFSDQTVTALNNNQFNFDVLLATPADMPKLAKYAKVLGPKGLMPNPKNGTVVTDPAARAKQMSSGATVAFKSEPKFPIIHLSLGKTSQKAEELTANLTTILREIGVTKIKSAYLTSTQTPSLKLDLSSL